MSELTMIAKHREQNAEHQAKFEAWLAETFRPLTPEEQVFFNGEVWLVFDAVTMADKVFGSKAEALEFASGHI